MVAKKPEEPIGKRAGIWIRVSTEAQAQGDSPKHHEERAPAYAEANGWKVVDVYHLEAVSGKSVMGHAAPPEVIPRPIPVVKSTDKLTQLVRWTNEATGKRPKPKGMFGAQLFLKVGVPPAGLHEMALVGVASAGPFKREFAAEDAGKPAHWVVRYTQKANGSGEFGPQSEVETATILG